MAKAAKRAARPESKSAAASAPSEPVPDDPKAGPPPSLAPAALCEELRRASRDRHDERDQHQTAHWPGRKHRASWRSS